MMRSTDIGIPTVREKREIERWEAVGSERSGEQEREARCKGAREVGGGRKREL
jgi:hypothetical protein